MGPTAGDFGDRLRRLREGRGLTQEELAERAGLSRASVASLERGRRSRPYPNTIRVLADALGLAEGEREQFTGVEAGQPVSAAPVGPAPPPVPVPPHPLIGRERDLAELAELLALDETRLVTLLGPGGVGKTRLATEVANYVGRMFPDGIAFVPLGAVGDPVLVIPTIARSLGLAEAGGQPLPETVRSYLRARRMLLVLDNVEQVSDAAPDVSELLSSCPGLVVLATSRAPLRVRVEREYPVRPLETPALERVPEPRDLEGNPAVALFVERARAVSPAFEVSRANAVALAAICRRLDGLPLALELAAARIRAMGPTELLARLDRSLPLLTGGARDLPERQRTMRATIEWSYQLLTEPEWRLVNRLSVFLGGWDLEAAEAVGEGGDIARQEVLDLLSSLVEQSLVLAEVGGGGVTRYRMLVPVREYAEERLEQSGEAEETRERHAEYCVALAREGYAGLLGPEQLDWLARLEADHDNIRAALSWLIERGDAERAAKLGYSVAEFWWMRGHLSEGRRWMGQVLALDPAPRTRAWALLTAAGLAWGQADAEGAAAIGEGLRIFRELADEEGTRLALGLTGLVAISRGDDERGLDLLEEAVARHFAAGDRRMAGLLLTYSAVVPLRNDDHARAERLSGQALALARETRDRLGIYAALYNLASVARARGDDDGAVRLFREALTLSAEMGDRGNAAYCLESMAAVFSARGEVRHAATLWGAAEVLLEGSEAAVYAHTPNRVSQRDAVAAARAGIAEPDWTAAWDEGRAMTLEQAVAYALVTTALAPPADGA